MAAPPAVADPTAYAFTHEGRNLVEQHNLFRTGDGHIHALWFNFETGWHHEDRTAMLGAPPAVGESTPYAFTHEGRNLVEQHNLFRTGNGHIHALWFSFENGWHHEDRTAMLGAPASVGDPAAYAFTPRASEPGRAAQPVPHRQRSHPCAVVQLRERLAPRGPHRDAGRPASRR